MLYVAKQCVQLPPVRAEVEEEWQRFKTAIATTADVARGVKPAIKEKKTGRMNSLQTEVQRTAKLAVKEASNMVGKGSENGSNPIWALQARTSGRPSAGDGREE